MKKVLFAVAAMATTVALTPAAFANSLTFNHDSPSITLDSDNPADQGTITLTDFAQILNTNNNKSLTIDGFVFFLGGNSVSGAAGDTPGEFLFAENGWTYAIGEGDLPSAPGNPWAKNSVPAIGGPVASQDSSKKNYLSSVDVINDASSGYCYAGEVLAPGADCEIELQITANYDASGAASDTFVYGFADGQLSGKGAGAASDSQFQGMEENIHIDVAPEPRSLVLLGTGFGLIGLVVFWRHRRAAARATIS
ncbi:MAG: hypothetical protein ABSD59_13865 [Terracidiphilus sp.]